MCGTKTENVSRSPFCCIVSQPRTRPAEHHHKGPRCVHLSAPQPSFLSLSIVKKRKKRKKNPDVHLPAVLRLSLMPVMTATKPAARIAFSLFKDGGEWSALRAGAQRTRSGKRSFHLSPNAFFFLAINPFLPLSFIILAVHSCSLAPHRSLSLCAHRHSDYPRLLLERRA